MTWWQKGKQAKNQSWKNDHSTPKVGSAPPDDVSEASEDGGQQIVLPVIAKKKTEKKSVRKKVSEAVDKH